MDWIALYNKRNNIQTFFLRLIGGIGFAVLCIAGTVLSEAADAGNKTEVFFNGISAPENMAFDGKGGLYVSGSDGLIRLDPKGKGTWLLRDVRVNGLAFGPKGRLFAAVEDEIHKVDVKSGRQTVYATGFGLPNGIDFDELGNLYVADTMKMRIVRIDRNRKQTTIENWLYMPNGLKYDEKTKSLLFTEMLSGKLRRIYLDEKRRFKGIETVFRVPGIFRIVDDITLDEHGNIYLCDYWNDRVIRIDAKGKDKTIVSGMDSPSSVLFGYGKGFNPSYLYITEKGLFFNGRRVLRRRISGL